MGLDQSPWNDVVEVRHCGRRKANIYLANGWTLIDVRGENWIRERAGPRDPETGEPTKMFLKVEEVTYVLGRTKDVEFEGDDVDAAIAEERRQRREQAIERAAQAVDEGSAVEAPASGTVCVHEWIEPAPGEVEAGRSCGKCGFVPTPSVLQDTVDERMRSLPVPADDDACDHEGIDWGCKKCRAAHSAGDRPGELAPEAPADDDAAHAELMTGEPVADTAQTTETIDRTVSS